MDRPGHGLPFTLRILETYISSILLHHEEEGLPSCFDIWSTSDSSAAHIYSHTHTYTHQSNVPRNVDALIRFFGVATVATRGNEIFTSKKYGFKFYSPRVQIATTTAKEFFRMAMWGPELTNGRILPFFAVLCRTVKRRRGGP